MKSKKVRYDFDVEIASLEEKIRYYDRIRPRWDIYDDVIGSPQDRLETRKEILEILRDAELSINI